MQNDKQISSEIRQYSRYVYLNISSICPQCQFASSLQEVPLSFQTQLSFLNGSYKSSWGLVNIGTIFNFENDEKAAALFRMTFDDASTCH